MTRKETPVALLASVVIHAMVLLAAARWLGGSRPVPHPDPEVPTTPVARIVFPPSEVWRPPAPPAQAAPAAPPTQPDRPDRPKAPEPTPPPARERKDRVSIGGPAPERQRTPLELRRDEELTRLVAQGRPDAPGTLASPMPGTATPPPEAPAVAAPSPQIAAAEPPPEATDAAEPEGDEPAAEVTPRSSAPTGPPQPSRSTSIGDSLRNLEDRLAQGPVGLESGAGQQMGPLFFDPQGADFTAWGNTFRIEVHRNWIVPQSVRFGVRGHVNIEFRVDREGKLTGLRIVRPSGTPALDRAASNALLGARLPPLPADYRPAQLVISVSFFYNERGQ